MSFIVASRGTGLVSVHGTFSNLPDARASFDHLVAHCSSQCVVLLEVGDEDGDERVLDASGPHSSNVTLKGGCQEVTLHG